MHAVHHTLAVLLVAGSSCHVSPRKFRFSAVVDRKLSVLVFFTDTAAVIDCKFAVIDRIAVIDRTAAIDRSAVIDRTAVTERIAVISLIA